MTGFLLMLMTPVALLAGSFVGARRQRLTWGQNLGLRLPSLAEALIWLLLFAALSTLSDFLYDYWHLEPAEQAWHLRYALVTLSVRIVLIALIYPIAEEVFFRGFIFGALSRRFGGWAAVVGSSLFFAVLHVQYELRGMLLVLVDAIFFALVRKRTNSTILTIALHALGNSYAVWQRL